MSQANVQRILTASVALVITDFASATRIGGVIFVNSVEKGEHFILLKFKVYHLFFSCVENQQLLRILGVSKAMCKLFFIFHELPIDRIAFMIWRTTR